MSDCSELIKDFENSIGEQFEIKYSNIGIPDDTNGSGYYNGKECKINNNDIDNLSVLLDKKKYKTTVFTDELYFGNMVVETPARIVIQSNK